MYEHTTPIVDEVRKKGTYVLSKFEEAELELKRLTKQASILPDVELSYLQKHGLKPGMQVLDAACGPGITSGMVYDHIRKGGGQLTGVDQDPRLIKIANRLADENDRQATFLVGDVYDLPFENQFDFIYCRFLFQHLAEPEVALQSLIRSLKPGGILNILDVNDEWLFLEPEVPAFKRLCELAKEHQARKGGNRLIGKHIRNRLAFHGMKRLQTEVLMVNSDMIGLSTFLELTTRFKKEIIDETGEDDPVQLLKEIDHAVKQQESFGACGIFSVSGLKPLKQET